MSFVVVRRRLRWRAHWFDWPVLYTVTRCQDGSLRTEIFKPLFDYFFDYSSRSQEWRRETAVSLGLLFDYSSQYVFRSNNSFSIDEYAETQILKEFAHAITFGTCLPNSALDPTGLYWPRRSMARADCYIGRLTSALLYLGSSPLHGGRSLIQLLLEQASIDPQSARSRNTEARLRGQKRLLAHLPSQVRRPRHFAPGIVKGGAVIDRPIFSFPRQYVLDFLDYGFITSKGDVNYEAQLVAHMIFVGGLRKSEPFHTYVSDVQFLDHEPIVFLHNPVQGTVRDPVSGKPVTRFEYLRQFGLLPRNLSTDRMYAGWKSIADDLFGASVHWLPIPELIERTRLLLLQYVSRVRPAVMRSRSPHLKDHPFLLVSPGAFKTDSGGSPGDPYSLSAFNEHWKVALMRLQRLHPNADLRHLKSLGTTPHGARHFYGRYLRSLGLSREVIQRCMHHRSPLSQDIYTAFSVSEVADILHSTHTGVL